jgi:hypothetical protein
MKRNKSFVLLLIILASCSQNKASHSQQNDVNIQKNNIQISVLSPVADKNKFPLIRLPNNKSAEDKINTLLQLEQLEHLPGVFKKNPFEKITYGHDDGTGGSVNFYNYSSNTTVSNVLSLALNGEATGAYSENFDYYYNFDLRTGNKILLQQLFTKDGLNTLTQILNKRVKKEIDDYLIEIQKPADTQKITAEDSEALDDEVGMYEECLGNVMTYDIEYYSFFFSNDSITFERERCSSHAMRALDDLDKFDIAIAFKDLKEYLSPYGESLLNNSMENLQTSSPEGKLYKGFINGKYPIHALISRIEEDGSFSMSYWYDKTKIPIEWTGSFDNSNFSMVEYEEHGDNRTETATVSAAWTGNNEITGTWTNSKTHETLKLELEAY